MTDNERDKLLNAIASDVRLIRDRQERDYNTIYGSGNKSGLVDDVAKLKEDMLLMKQGKSTWRTVVHYIATIISAIVSGGVVGWISTTIAK
jgi:hypothetical protein